MRGDILIIDDNHRRAAKDVAKLLYKVIPAHLTRLIISIGGESGSGKSEIAASLAVELEKKRMNTLILQQDDYFFLPPKTNAAKRKTDIHWVGMQEVNLKELDQNLEDFLSGKDHMDKPLVIFGEDKKTREMLKLSSYKAIIVEGTYTTALEYPQCKVFIDRNLEDTREARKKRARENQDDFLEKILTIEHQIISPQKAMADIVITKDFHAIINKPSADDR